MADTIFIAGLVAYLAIATTLLYRAPTHGWGFPMFFLLYPLFLCAFLFASTRVVQLAWLSLAVLNMVFQFRYLASVGVKKGVIGILVASLIFWPLQFAGAINSSQTEEEERENQEQNRERIGPLPATISGTVSFTHHHGTEKGHDSVWLEEYGDLAFVTDAKTYDRIGIAEGKSVSLTIEERDATEALDAGNVLWIVDGSSGGSVRRK
ncbi:MAG: hypothetical protein AAFN50_01820 [Pseudomonadota bacterium]